MKTILKFTVFTAILLILTGGLASCKKEEPKEIPFSGYCLNDPPCLWTNRGDCRWTNLSYNNGVIIINDRKKMENYVSCTNFPNIDFSTRTLLLANGSSPNGISGISTAFYKNSRNKYTMSVSISLNNNLSIDR